MVALPLVVAVALVLTGCSGDPLADIGGIFRGTTVEQARADKAAETVQTIPDESLVAPGTLTVGLQTGSVGAPFLIMDEAGHVEGIDVDLASALAAELGLQVSFVDVGGVESSLSNRTCDVVMNVSPERAGGSTVVGSYCESATGFFHKGAQTVATVGDLASKTVGLQAGSVSEGILNSVTLDMVRKPYNNLNEAFEGLDAGEVDYVLCDAYPGAYLASAHEGLTFAGALSSPTPIGISARTDAAVVQTEVKRALDSLLSDGTFDVIRGRWLGGMPSISADEVILNVAKSDKAPAQGGSTESMDGGTSQDGPAAGANAVTLPDESESSGEPSAETDYYQEEEVYYGW